MRCLDKSFYRNNAVELAQQLLGKILVRQFDNGEVKHYRITETEAYYGSNDEACHAHKGRTARTEIMFADGGCLYVYFIYGMYWLLNIVTGEKNHPEAVLIRGIDNIQGSGRVGRELQIDRSFYGEDLLTSDRIWLEEASNNMENIRFDALPRIGIDYAGEEWKNKAWRFKLIDK